MTGDPWTEEDLAAFVADRQKARRLARPTIEDLESIFDDEEYTPIEILPNGEIREIGGGKKAGVSKPLTMREDLGGEYGRRAA